MRTLSCSQFLNTSSWRESYALVHYLLRYFIWSICNILHRTGLGIRTLHIWSLAIFTVFLFVVCVCLCARVCLRRNIISFRVDLLLNFCGIIQERTLLRGFLYRYHREETNNEVASYDHWVVNADPLDEKYPFHCHWSQHRAVSVFIDCLSGCGQFNRKQPVFVCLSLSVSTSSPIDHANRSAPTTLPRSWRSLITSYRMRNFVSWN